MNKHSKKALCAVFMAAVCGVAGMAGMRKVHDATATRFLEEQGYTHVEIAPIKEVTDDLNIYTSAPLWRREFSAVDKNGKAEHRMVTGYSSFRTSKTEIRGPSWPQLIKHHF